jgi:acyl-CoA reductase-like NAD-dependent aldehyde dehydrogenase/nicotinamidase-related amidase
MGPCLIPIDLQGAFLDDRSLEPARDSVLAGVSAWLDRFRGRELPVIHVRTTVLPEGPALPHWGSSDRGRCRHGAPTWRFAPQASPREAEPIVDKTHYSGFQSGRLLQLLREAEAQEVVIVGVHLHGCVRSTALDASASGLEVTIGVDAVGSNDPPHAAATRRWMSERGFRFAELQDWDSDGRSATAAGAKGRAAAAAGRASDAFGDWSALGVERRVATLEPLGALLRESSAWLAESMAAGIHKPVGEGLAEVSYAADLADQALARAAESLRRTPDGLARRVPHGPVLLVTPWNNPIGIPVGKIVPALAHGNTVLWKPAPQASSVSAELCDLLGSLDLPSGSLERVEGGPDEVAALVRGGDVRAVSLSGSLGAGRALHDLCAAELIPFQAELGGNNAAIVCVDTDIDEAAEAIVTGAFGFAGQRCTATRRAIVVAEAYAALSDAVKERVEALQAGDPRSGDSDFAPVISAVEAARVEALLDRVGATGAEVWRPRWAQEPAFAELRRAFPFVAPAVVENAAPGSEIVRHESFGPALVLMEAATLAEAIRLCNDVPQGLVAAIHTRSPQDVDHFTQSVRAGILRVNQSTAGASASLPFGGFGLSGVGPPEHGEGDGEFHARWQAVYGGQGLPSTPRDERPLAKTLT